MCIRDSHELLRPLSQQDIDTALCAWNGDIESKHAVVRYMKDHAREKDTAAWLAQAVSYTHLDVYKRQDGDVIDFTAKLFDLSPKEAAEKLAQDFGLIYDSQARCV